MEKFEVEADESFDGCITDEFEWTSKAPGWLGERGFDRRNKFIRAVLIQEGDRPRMLIIEYEKNEHEIQD